MAKHVHAILFAALLVLGFRLCYQVLNTPADQPAEEAVPPVEPNPAGGWWYEASAWVTILVPVGVLVMLGRAWYRTLRLNLGLEACSEPFRGSLVPPLTAESVGRVYALARRGDMGLALVLAGLAFWASLALLFLGSSWVGVAGGVLCAAAVALWALLPPAVLVLGNSNLATFELFRAVKAAARPFRCVHMLEFSADLSGSPGRADLRLHALTASFRGGDDLGWRATIRELMEFVPLIVIDTRILTGPIREELEWLAGTPAGRKAIFYTGGSPDPPAAVQAGRAVGTLDALVGYVRKALRSERTMAHLHFGASLEELMDARD